MSPELFKPEEEAEEPLISVDDLVEENPVDSKTASAAANQWKVAPPDEEFANILDAKEVRDGSDV